MVETLIHVIIPIFSIILCGFLAGRLYLIPAAGAWALNGYIYYFALPALLFISLAEASREEITSFSFIAVNVVTCFVVMMTAFVLFLFLFRKNLPESVIYGMASAYGNTGFLGIPLTVTAFGPEAAVPAAIVSFSCDLLIITIVVVGLEAAGSAKTAIGSSLVRAVLKNPINVSLLLGSMTAFLQFPVPDMVNVFTETLGGAAGPTALFAIGLGLVQGSAKNRIRFVNRKEFLTVFGLKLIVMPLAAWVLVTVVFEIRELWAETVILLSAMPTGAVVNVFAQKYHTASKEIPQIVMISTLTSIGSILFLLFFLT